MSEVSKISSSLMYTPLLKDELSSIRKKITGSRKPANTFIRNAIEKCRRP